MRQLHPTARSSWRQPLACRSLTVCMSETPRPAPALLALKRRALLAAAIACTSITLQTAAPAPAAVLDLRTPFSALQQQERTVEDLFTRATKSVVSINTFVERTDRLTMNAIEVPRGTGSGFVWDKEGHIVTNYHVIRGANGAKVGISSADGTKTFDAILVGYNPDKDVAVLKLKDNTEALQPLDIGCSGLLRVGQTTLAIGNPFGLDHTLTVGIVSGLGREVSSPSGRPITNVIQTDAAINPGNSGGALLDSSGQLIGMNTAIYSTSGGFSGIGFAIPVDTLKMQVPNIIKYGKVLRPAIGISYMEGSQARALGVDQGVLVMGVPEDSNAAKAGLRGTFRRETGEVSVGDVIVGINNVVVKNEADLFRALDGCQPGEKVTLKVKRAEAQEGELRERPLSLDLTLQAIEAV